MFLMIILRANIIIIIIIIIIITIVAVWYLTFARPQSSASEAGAAPRLAPPALPRGIR